MLKTTAPNQRQFDLIVLDLCMPVTDGYEACRLILAYYNSKNDLRFSVPKIIAVSGYVDNEVQAATAKAGFEMVYPMPLGVPQI